MDSPVKINKIFIVTARYTLSNMIAGKDYDKIIKNK